LDLAWGIEWNIPNIVTLTSRQANLNHWRPGESRIRRFRLSSFGYAMSDADPKFDYRVVGEESLETVCPLWEKLRAHHSPLLSHFPGEKPPFIFGPRKRELLAKAAPGKIRVEFVTIASDGVDIAYCISTVSASGRGEVDSMFVEEGFRGRGIGSNLIRHALTWMESMGASSRVVTVAHANEEALAFYKRFGFHPRTILLQQLCAPSNQIE
jgi:GNAT superfamily N-acetyltransferase